MSLKLIDAMKHPLVKRFLTVKMESMGNLRFWADLFKDFKLRMRRKVPDRFFTRKIWD